jgi:hypothetical protein
MLTPEMSLAWMAKLPKKILILKVTPQTKILARLVHCIKVKGAVAEVEGEAVEAEVAAGAEAIRKKGSGIAFSTKKMTTTTQNIAQTRKDLRPSPKKRRRRKRGIIP